MRLIDADALINATVKNPLHAPYITAVDVEQAPTIGSWISVKDRLPEQHKSIFAPWYGRKEWSKAMWLEESEKMIVAIRFPDGTCTVGTGRLHDGKWKTEVSQTLNPVVTHWMPLPEPPKQVTEA